MAEDHAVIPYFVQQYHLTREQAAYLLDLVESTGLLSHTLLARYSFDRLARNVRFSLYGEPLRDSDEDTGRTWGVSFPTRGEAEAFCRANSYDLTRIHCELRDDLGNWETCACYVQQGEECLWQLGRRDDSGCWVPRSYREALGEQMEGGS